MYPFPVSTDEKDHVVMADQSITLKSYGLPYLFWGYGAAIAVVLIIMFMAIWEPASKMISLSLKSGSYLDLTLTYLVLSLFFIIPASVLLLLFYEKRLIKKNELLTVEHRILGLKLAGKNIKLSNQDKPFVVKHHLDSPNMAKLTNKPEMRAFQNQGYFQLFALNENSEEIFVDRHARKADLEKIAQLLKN